MQTRLKLLTSTLALILLFAANASALEDVVDARGWPNQDPKVADAQKAFESGLAVNDSAYHLGARWECTILEAKKGISNDVPMVAKGFLSFQDVGMPGYIGNAGTGKVSLFLIEKAGLSGAYREYQFGTRVNFMLYVRSFKENADRLIVEWSILASNLSGSERSSRYNSAINADYRVDRYLDCTPMQ